MTRGLETKQNKIWFFLMFLIFQKKNKSEKNGFSDDKSFCRKVMFCDHKTWIQSMKKSQVSLKNITVQWNYTHLKIIQWNCQILTFERLDVLTSLLKIVQNHTNCSTRKIQSADIFFLVRFDVFRKKIGFLKKVWKISSHKTVASNLSNWVFGPLVECPQLSNAIIFLQKN